MKSSSEFDSMVWNCTSNGKAPNWADYDGFEFSAVVQFFDCDGNPMLETCDSDTPESEIFAWTVYGHIADEMIGGVCALHDCDTKSEALALLRYCESKI